MFRKIPFTLAIISFNALAFILSWIIAGTLSGSTWTTTLLRLGAQFNPLTLDKEPYRIFSHLFLHGSITHMAVNMYVLLYVGYALEGRVGTKKFAFVYFLSGIAAALGGLYGSLFTIGVGTSGVICGLFGFYLVYGIFFSGKSGKSMLILLIHFSLFAALHLIIPERMYADYAAMFGGVIAGILIGFASFARGRHAVISKVKVEYLMILPLALLFLLVPGDQVRYFKFFQQVVAAEDTTRHLIKEKLTDDDMRAFIRNYHHWEDILTRLNNQPRLPGELAADTFKLRKYIDLRKQENMLKKLVVQREAYVYLDSVDRLQEVMRKYMDLDYKLWSRIKPEPPLAEAMISHTVKVLYDSNGTEISKPPLAYYRVGVKDSLGRWNGPFREYDSNDRLRAKGSLKQNKREGVFLFYSEKGVVAQAGRYLDGKKFGKWQTFYQNGKLASEIFHNNGYFVSTVWDSLGNQLVVDGNGREVLLYPDDVVKVYGEYRHGLKEGTWYGRYPNGEMYYEEIFDQGRLISGKSRTQDGETFLYDESSLHAFPDGGFENFQQYLKEETRKAGTDEMGHVKLSFRITRTGALTDVTIDQGATLQLDVKAREILLKGPRWLPARSHGHEPVDSWGFVQVEFY